MIEQFEIHRKHLREVAYRMLGDSNEADDAVQEAWIRLNRADTSDVDNIGGWLTTVVARICLDMLRSRGSRREEPMGDELPDGVIALPGRIDPEEEVMLGDSVGAALLVVLDTLSPAERLAFVLHDMFAMPFDEIAPIVGRSPVAVRQLASRARRRVQGTSTVPDAQNTRRREIVDAFLAASRNADFEALLAVLDPEVVLRADAAAVTMGASEDRGAAAVAKTFEGRARAAQPASVGGTPGLAWATEGEIRVAFTFTIVGAAITEIEMVADPDRIRELDVTILRG